MTSFYPYNNISDIISNLRNQMGVSAPGGLSDELAAEYIRASGQQGSTAVQSAVQFALQQQQNELRFRELMGADANGAQTDAAQRWRDELKAQQAVQGTRLSQELTGLMGTDAQGNATLAERQRTDATAQAELERQLRERLQGSQQTFQGQESAAERAARLQLQESQQGFQSGESDLERQMRLQLQREGQTFQGNESQQERDLRERLQSGQLGQQESEFARTYGLQALEQARRGQEMAGYLDNGNLTEAARAARATEAARMSELSGQIAGGGYTEESRAAREQERTQRAALAAQLMAAPKDVFKAGAYFRSLGGSAGNMMGLGGGGISGFNTMGDRMTTPGTVSLDDVDAMTGGDIAQPASTGALAGGVNAPNAATNQLSPTAPPASGGTAVTGQAAPTTPAAPAPVTGMPPTPPPGQEPTPGMSPGGPVDDAAATSSATVQNALGNLGLQGGTEQRGRGRGRGRRRREGQLTQDPGELLRAAMSGQQQQGAPQGQDQATQLRQMLGLGQGRDQRKRAKESTLDADMTERATDRGTPDRRPQGERELRQLQTAQQTLQGGADGATAGGAPASDEMSRIKELLGTQQGDQQQRIDDPGFNPNAAAERWQQELGAQQGVQQERMAQLQGDPMQMRYMQALPQMGADPMERMYFLRGGGGMPGGGMGGGIPTGMDERMYLQGGGGMPNPGGMPGGGMGSVTGMPTDAANWQAAGMPPSMPMGGADELQRMYAQVMPRGPGDAATRWQQELGAQQGMANGRLMQQQAQFQGDPMQMRFRELMGSGPMQEGVGQDWRQGLIQQQQPQGGNDQMALLSQALGQPAPGAGGTAQATAPAGLQSDMASQLQGAPTDTAQTAGGMAGGSPTAETATGLETPKTGGGAATGEASATLNTQGSADSASGGTDPAADKESQVSFGTQPGGPVGGPTAMVAAGLGDLGIGGGGTFQGRQPPAASAAVSDSGGRIPYVDPRVLDEPELRAMFRDMRQQGVRDDAAGRTKPRRGPSGPGGPVGGRSRPDTVVGVGPYRFGQKTAESRRNADERMLRGLNQMLQRGQVPGSQPGGPVAAPLMPESGSTDTSMPSLQEPGSVGSFSAPSSPAPIPSMAPDTQQAALDEMKYRLAQGPGAMGPQTLEKMSGTQKGVMEGALEALGLDAKDFEQAYAQTRFANTGNVLSA